MLPFRLVRIDEESSAKDDSVDAGEVGVGGGARGSANCSSEYSCASSRAYWKVRVLVHPSNLEKENVSFVLCGVFVLLGR